MQLIEYCPVCEKLGKKTVAIVKSELEKNNTKIIHYTCGHFVIQNIPKGTAYDSIIFDGSSACKHTWTLPVKATYKTICSKCNAKRPYPFQILGMKAIEKGLALNKGFAVLDSMGLGKTIQGLGYIKFLPPDKLPVLFVVKSGLKYQFAKEIIRILGDSYFPMIISSGKDGVMPGLKCYIIGYDMLRNFPSDKLKSLNIKLIVLDEVQQIKNPDSSRTTEVRNLCKTIPSVLPLSGTPWKNRGSELFVMFNLLDPAKFPSFQLFLDRWVDYKQNADGKYKEAGIRDPKKFKEYVKDLCIRREPEEVLPEFPPISRHKLICEIPEVEKNAYNEEMDDFVKWFNQLTLEGENVNESQLIAKLARMRHILGLAKIPFTVEHIKEYIEESDGKLLLGVHHKDVADIFKIQLGKFLKDEYPFIPLLEINSSMDGSQRFIAQNKFNDTKRCIMIASTLAAGEGLNLQTCDYGIMHERQWNPANEEQFEGRLRRIGQLKRIQFQYIHAQGTIDEHFDNLVENKRINFNAVMNHDFISLPTNEEVCKICRKSKEEHKVQWNGNSLLSQLAIQLVEDSNKNKKLRLVRAKR